MFLSYGHKFLFTRVYKTGSSSFQSMLEDADIALPGDHVCWWARCKPSQEATVRDLFKANPFPVYRPRATGFMMRDSAPLMCHITPARLVQLGALTEEQLFSFNVFAFIRDPIDRWISAIFFEAEINKHFSPQGVTREFILQKIKDNPYTMVFADTPYAAWFTYHGERIGTPIDYPRLTETAYALVAACGGAVKQEHRHKSKYRPDWAREPYTEWLPKTYIGKLCAYLQDDINFYTDNGGSMLCA